MICASVLLAAVTITISAAEEKGGNHETGPYEVDEHWPQPLDPKWGWGRTPAADVQSDHRIYLLQSHQLDTDDRKINNNHLPLYDAVTQKNVRKHNITVVVNSEGKFIESWKQYHDKWANLHRTR